MPYIIDPKTIKKSSDELYRELLKIPKNTAKYELKFREYLTKNFQEQSLPPPEFKEEITLPSYVPIKKRSIKNIKEIKCWEYQPAEVKARKLPIDIEGWDICKITTSLGDIINVRGVAHIILDDRNEYLIEELVSDDDMFKLRLKDGTEVDMDLIPLTTVSGEMGIYTDLKLEPFKTVFDIYKYTPTQYKEELRKKGYDESEIERLTKERKELFESGRPSLLRKHLTAIKESAPEKLE